jgi:uncharacterized protein (UPF0210 family)
MKIRSITSFYHPGAAFADRTLDQLAAFSAEARDLFSSVGLEVQTTRLATPPFSSLCPSDCMDSGISLAETLEAKSQSHGFDYLSLGPALVEKPESYKLIPGMIAATQSVFFGGVMVGPKGISPAAVRSCAEAIVEIAKVSSDGFANLRFAALANVEPFSPFFPAAYSQGEKPGFAFALEAADLAVKAFTNAGSLKDAQDNLIEALQNAIKPLVQIADGLSQKYAIAFKGIDLSLAPFPAEHTSIGNSLEKLGLNKLGQTGSVAAAAFLASTLDMVQAPRVGFSGLMLPVLEDSTLAARTTAHTLSLKDLLLFSTMCGTGLDTIPLPGDTTADQLYALLLDISAISQRLQKPLTARLMPIPGKQAGDSTDFNFDYFANGTVMALDAVPLMGNLAHDHDLPIIPRKIA